MRIRRAVAAWGTWETDSTAAKPAAPRRFVFDARARALARRLPPLRHLGVVSGTMPSLALASSAWRPARWLDGLLRGASQVVIVNNPVAGVLILASLF